MSFSYPFSKDWSTNEIIAVVQFFETIENAYEQGVNREVLVERYRRFKEVVPSMAEEKTYFRDFEKESGRAQTPALSAQEDLSILRG